jgi:Na+/H+-dicarboxylate symporter
MPLHQLYSIPTGLLLGIVLALLVPAGAPYVAWLGQVFISLLKLLILPLILVSIYASLARGEDLRRIGGRALLYYVMTSAVAATLGTLIGMAFSADLPAGVLDLEQVEATGDGFSLVVDRFFDYPITAINVWGDLVVAAIVDREVARD